MANTPKNGTSYLLSTKTGPVVTGQPTWVTAVCLTSNGWSATGDRIDTSSKCTGGYTTSIDGRKGWTMSGEAQLIPGTPDTGTVSFKHYFALWKAGTVFAARITNTDDPTDIIRGDVAITGLDETFPDNDVATWTITLTGQGEPLITVEA